IKPAEELIPLAASKNLCSQNNNNRESRLACATGQQSVVAVAGFFYHGTGQCHHRHHIGSHYGLGTPVLATYLALFHATPVVAAAADPGAAAVAGAVWRAADGAVFVLVQRLLQWPAG